MNKLCLVIVLCFLSAALLAEDFVMRGEPAMLAGPPVAVCEAEAAGAPAPWKAVRDPGASGGRALFCSVEKATGKSLVCGRFEGLRPGKYIAVFRLKIDKDYSYPEDTAVFAGVTAGDGGAGYGESRFLFGEFGEGWTLAPFAFEAREGDGAAEALVKSARSCDIWVDKVEIFECKGPLPALQAPPAKRAEYLEPGTRPRGLGYRPSAPGDGGIFPVSKPVSKHIFAIDCRDRDYDQLMLTSLQGLVNRDRPQLYLLVGREKLWLDRLTERGDVEKVTYITPRQALKRFSRYYKGAVITDRRIPATVNTATMYAAVYGGLVCSERTAAEYGLPALLDLRGRYGDDAEAYYSAYAELWDRLDHSVSLCLHGSISCPRDYAVQHKLFVFWAPGVVDGALTPADQKKDLAFVNFLLAQLPPNTPVLGYPFAGEGVGIGEGGGVGLFARYGHFLVPSDYSSNLSVHSGARRAELRQKEPRRIPLEAGKRYVAFTMSDGDNLQVLANGGWAWETDARGKVPITWNMSPSASMLIPDVADYYYSTATENDSFGAAVSGVGYTYPALYGERFKDAEPVFDGFLALTDKYMKEMDMRVLAPMGVTEKELAHIAEKLPGIKGLLPDYARSRDVTRYDEGVFLTSGNMPVVRAGTSMGPDSGDPEEKARFTAREITDFAGVEENEPAFIHAFLCNWGYGPAIVDRIAELLPENYVFVSGEELALLEKEYMREKRLLVSAPPETACIEGFVSRLTLKAQNTGDSPFEAAFDLKGVAGFSPLKKKMEPGKPETVVLDFVPAGGRITLEVSFEGRTVTKEITANLYDGASFPAGQDPAKLELAAHYNATNMPSINAESYTSEDGTRYRAAISGESKSGAIVFGPYKSMEKGRYLAAYNLVRLDEKGKSDPVCTQDIAAEGQKLCEKQLFRRDLPVGKRVTLYVPFDWDSKNGLETRIFWDTESDSLRVDGVSIFRITDR
ncbi:MAG: hypothetical protein ILO36_01405 [Abditibacteriota bacterium]|nr:hypothetical protein [Abditibacteriota bacterium]